MTENTETIEAPEILAPIEDNDETTFRTSATFIEAGQQLQTAFIGLQPQIVITPEYDEDEDVLDFVTTVVDFTPQGLVEILEILLDGARQMVEQDLARLPEREAEIAAEQAAAEVEYISEQQD